jgi:hypothetical protein
LSNTLTIDFGNFGAAAAAYNISNMRRTELKILLLLTKDNPLLT